MALDWKAAISFSAKDDISSAVEKARKTTEKSSKGIGEAMDGAGKKADNLKEKIGSIGDIAAGVAIGNFITKGIEKGVDAIKGLIASIPEFTARADEVGKMSYRLGLTAEALQRYRYAASQANIGSNSLNTAFQNMNKQIGSGALYASLDKLNAGLAAQVRQAGNVEDAFNTIAHAAANYNDVGQRTAVLMAAFGKAGNELVPMLNDLGDQLYFAEKYGNIIDGRTIAMTQLWNSTLSDVKNMVQGFGDILRGAVIQYVGPYVLALKEWLNINREMIKQKIEAAVQKAVVVFKKAVSIIQDVVRKVQSLIQFFKEWVRLILVIGGAVGLFVGLVSAVVAIKKAVETAKAAFAIFNAVVSANPIGVIVFAVAAAVAGFALLAKKVGGVVPALEVVKETFFKCLLTPVNLIIDAIQFLLPMGARIGIVIAESFKAAGQTIMKCMLTPINLVISGIGGLLGAISKIPGADWAKDAAAGIKTFQDKMNTALTGSESTLLSGGPAFLLDPARNTASGMADKVQAAEAWALSGVSGLQGFQDKMNTMLTGSTSTLTSDPSGFLFDSYDRHRAAYLSDHPETATGGDSTEERKFNQMVEAIKEGFSNPVPVNVELNVTNPSSGPPNIRYRACGVEDFWETARYGI